MCLASTWSCIANFRNGSSSECWPPEGCRRDCVRLALALADEWAWPLLRGSVYFLAQVDPSTIPADPQAQWAMCMNLPGCIELTWNYGSEKAEGKVYNTGNSDTTGSPNGEAVKGGFGHLGITVPDVYDACERFKQMGCEFAKTPNSGGMKGLAFLKDPDGYLVEVLPRGPMITKPVDCNGVAVDGGAGYKDNSKA